MVCHAWPAKVFCNACVQRFAAVQRRCQRCAMPHKQHQSTCSACHHREWPLDQTQAGLRYAYPWPPLIKHFKFQESTGWAQHFADLMRRNPQLVECLNTADFLIPMPLSGARLRERGFNQSLLLAKALCPDKVCTDLLLRQPNTPAQSGLSSAQRWRNVQDAYSVTPKGLPGRAVHWVLLDDVMTTGASLCAAARALRLAGATQVSAVVLARAE